MVDARESERGATQDAVYRYMYLDPGPWSFPGRTAATSPPPVLRRHCYVIGPDVSLPVVPRFAAVRTAQGRCIPWISLVGIAQKMGSVGGAEARMPKRPRGADLTYMFFLAYVSRWAGIQAT